MRGTNKTTAEANIMSNYENAFMEYSPEMENFEGEQYEWEDSEWAGESGWGELNGAANRKCSAKRS